MLYFCVTLRHFPGLFLLLFSNFTAVDLKYSKDRQVERLRDAEREREMRGIQSDDGERAVGRYSRWSERKIQRTDLEIERATER